MNTLDLAVAALTGVFALAGAFSGFSRQVAQSVALALGFLVATPIGRFFGEAVAQVAKCSLTVGVVLATVFGFAITFLVARFIVVLILKKIISGQTLGIGFTDRFLGFLMGGIKTFFVAYLGICAATFTENNLVFGGKKLAFTPKDSVLVGLSRQYNIIEFQQFSDAKELLQTLKAGADSKLAVRDNRDFAALMKDSRVQKLMASDSFKQALESGDIKTLMKSDEASSLLFDDKVQAILKRLSMTSEPLK
jgi:membrane protein required for colicin V production